MQVNESEEFHRILALPRRVWDEQAHVLADRVTKLLKTPSGRMILHPVQAQALIEAAQVRGLFCPIPVGGGKTLVSLLVPTVFAARRPMLIIPKHLLDKTMREWRELLYAWRISRTIKIITYQSLSRVSHETALEDYRPDLVICDEGHRIKNDRAACTRRVMRYLRNYPTVPFVVLSGTLTNNSIMEYHHLITRTHGVLSPLPTKAHDAELWADALDNRTMISRPSPGALLRFATKADVGMTELATARAGYQRRLTETPGVITLKNTRAACSLTYSRIPLEVPQIVREAIGKLEGSWETPDAWPLTNPMEVWRHTRELLMGFFYRWNPRPPKAWLDARREWGKFVRETISRSRHLDSEMHVALNHPDEPCLLAWHAIRDTFVPNSEPVWLSDHAVDMVGDWLKEPGLAWVEHAALGARVADKYHVPFHGQGGNPIRDEGKAIVVSVHANSEGQNLQHGWARNLVTSPGPSSKAWEQMIGRTHRLGQPKDEVTVEILTARPWHEEALDKALESARYVQGTTGVEQKLLYGDWT